MSDLSIIIPSHSRADLLTACLQSIHDHATHDLQVIVIDDASPHGHIERTARCFWG